MKHDYSKLDAAILARIKSLGPVPFVHLHAGEVADESIALENAVRGKAAGRADDKPAWRFVDSRLQALRKAGHIRYQRKPEGWVRVEKA